MDAVTSAAEDTLQDLLACGKQMARYQNQTTEKHHGPPLVKISRLKTCKYGKIVQHLVTTQRVINWCINDADVFTSTLEKCALLCCRVNKDQGGGLKNPCTSTPS